MQVKKQDINVGKAIFEGEIKSGAEGSIIVPDVKPDILKVLQVDAETFLTEKSVDNGKIILKGTVLVDVLYLPETEGERVQCIKGCFEFCETVKRSEFEPGMEIYAGCDVSKVGYKLINSRKIGIESYVVINISVTSNEKIQFIKEILEDSCEIKPGSVSLKEACENKEFSFLVEENLTFPYDDAVEILKTYVTVLENEYRTITGKIVVKGKINTSVLYARENDCYEHYSFEIPFTEVFDWSDVEEDSECDITFSVLKSEFKLIESAQNNEKSLTSHIEVQAFVRQERCTNIEYINDCYFTDCDCNFDYVEIECEEILDKPNFSGVLKQAIEKSEKMPEISSVYTTVAKPYITSTEIQNGKIAVFGRATVYVLYTSEDPKIPLSSITEDIPFSYMIDCSNATRESEVLLSVECEHISCTLNDRNSVEIRCGIGIKGKVIKKTNISLLSEINVVEHFEKDKSLTIYFVKSGDTLWDIGKRYRVKCDDILIRNQLEDDTSIKNGQKIIIPLSK